MQWIVIWIYVKYGNSINGDEDDDDDVATTIAATDKNSKVFLEFLVTTVQKPVGKLIPLLERECTETKPSHDAT